MERRGLLYRSLWSEVSIQEVSAHNSSHSCLRRFERELEALRRELAEVTARSSEQSSPLMGPQSDDEISTVAGSPDSMSKPLSPEEPATELPLPPLAPGCN